MEYFKQALKDRTVIHGKIEGAIPNGAVMYVNGIRCMIPTSGLSLEPIDDTVFWLGKELDVQVIRVDEKREQVTLSARGLLIQEERRKARELRRKRLESLHVGDIVNATVKELMDFGAFVDLGDGLQGLIHVSQISSDRRINKPSEALNIGDEVQAMVTSIRDGKVSLSIRKIAEKEAEEKRRREEAEYPKEYYDEDAASTSMAGLLSGIKLEE